MNLACIYCRRSHMTCDENRPCQRWCVFAARRHRSPCSIKRDIGHLCRDEASPASSANATRGRGAQQPVTMPYGGSAPSLPIIGASGGSPLSDKGHGAAGPGATPLVPGLTNAADAGAGTGVVQVGDNNRADFSARGTLGQGAMPCLLYTSPSPRD